MNIKDFLKSIGCDGNYLNKFRQSSSLTYTPHKGYENTPWLNFDDKSVLVYLKGNHRGIRKVVEKGANPETISHSRLPNPGASHIFIPLVDPIYHFFGGYFSGTMRLKDEIISPYFDPNAEFFSVLGVNVHHHGNNPSGENFGYNITNGDVIYTYFKQNNISTQDQIKFIFQLLDQITVKIIQDDMISEEHTKLLPLRLIMSFQDDQFPIEKVVPLDLQKGGMARLIECFSNNSAEEKLKLHSIANKRPFAYPPVISTAIELWMRQNMSPHLLNKFRNEYILFDYLKYKGSIDWLDVRIDNVGELFK